VVVVGVGIGIVGIAGVVDSFGGGMEADIVVVGARSGRCGTGGVV
jgi:hypothetical protein